MTDADKTLLSADEMNVSMITCVGVHRRSVNDGASFDSKFPLELH